MALLQLNSTMKVITSVPFIMLSVLLYSNVNAQERAGEILQMLEKKDQLPKEKKKLPVIEQQIKKPGTEEALSSKKIFVKKIEIEGNTLLDTAELRSVVAPAEGKELSLDDLRNVADLITTRYRDEGYLIVNAFVPSQSINNGVVVIKVVEGKVGDITVTGNKSYSTPFIQRHLVKIKDDPSLNDETLERALLILNDYPSLAVKASLKAGKEPGTTDVVVGVTDKFPIAGSLSYDTYGDRTTSRSRLVASADVGNLITSGDLVMLRGVMGLDKIDLDRLSYGRVEYMVPVGGSGTQLGGYFANSVYQASGSLAPLNLNGKARVYGLYGSYPLVKKRDEALSLRFGGDYIDVDENLVGSPRSKDKIRKLTLTASYFKTDRFLGRNFLGFGYSRGLGGFIDGSMSDTPVNGIPTSRLGAKDDFNKFSFDALRIQKLPGYNLLIIRGSAQYSPDRLFVAEQFLLGGEGTVRGYNPAKFSGDSGYNISLELATSPFFADRTIFKQKVGDTIKLALFADNGGVFTTDTQVNEPGSDNVTGVGAGIRLYGGQFFSFKLDWAVPMSGKISAKSSKTYLQASLTF
jgi:hemolysin activation/secretion protein